ncbi:MAG: flavin reductase family protein [Actinomycetales bacterium]
MTALAPRQWPAPAPDPTRPTGSTLRQRVGLVAARLLDGLATPLVSADYLDVVAPLRAGAELSARVVQIHPETADASTLVLHPGRDWAGHLPGQYARIGVEVDGVRLWRTYSLTSPPVLGTDRDARISITVRAVPGGAVSTALLTRTQVGDLVHLGQAEGSFVLSPSHEADLGSPGAAIPVSTHTGEGSPAAPGGPDAGSSVPTLTPVLFVTGGSGITPVMGMLTAGLADTGRDVVVVHSSSTPESTIFGPTLRRWADEGRIRFVEWHTRTRQRLTPDALLELVPDADTREVYLCGPAGLVESLQTRWAARGAGHRVHTEVFHTPIQHGGDGGAVHFERSGVQTQAQPGQSLLVAGEAAGATLPYGCRQGLCFGCVVPLLDGSVRDLRTGEETHASAGDGVSIQTCITTASGFCHVDG